MFFELAYHDVGLATTEEEYQQAIDKALHRGKVSEKALAHAMEEQFPDAKVMVTSRSEKRRRAEIGQKLQDSMTGWLRDHFETTQERRKKPRKAMNNRALTSDTLLNLPHPAQNEEFERRYDIIANGTAKQKGDLVIEVFEGFKRELTEKGWTRDRLKQLTDKEIVDNFEFLQQLMGWHGAMENLSDDFSIELTEAQRRDFREFETEFDIVPSVYNRMRVISNPYYSMVRMGELPEFDPSDLNIRGILGEYANEGVEEPEENAEEAENDEFQMVPDGEPPAIEAVNEVFNAVGSARAFMKTAMQTEVMRELEGASCKDVLWFDEDGSRLSAWRNPRSSRKDPYEPPLDRLCNCHTLTAILPNGAKKTFAMKWKADGSVRITKEAEPAIRTAQPQKGKKLFTDRLNETISTQLKAVASGLNKADPWYIQSSSSFKDLKAAVDKVQKEWRALPSMPTKEQLDRLQTQMQSLADTSQAYLDSKKDKEVFNDLEQARMGAVHTVKSFALEQLGRVQTLVKQTTSPEVQADIEAYRQERENIRENRQAASHAQNEEIRNFQNPNVAKVNEFKQFSCPPSNTTNYALKNLQDHIADGTLERLFSAAALPNIPAEQQTSLKRDMAELTVFHLIMTERGGRQFSGNAGPIEQALTANRDALINSVSNLPIFNHCIGDITPSRLNDFIMNDGARRISKQLIEAIRDQKKQAENPAPEKTAKKDLSNPMNK